MLTQRDSILHLLADEDSETADLVQEQLLARSSDVLGDLRELLPEANGRAERRLRELMGQMESRVAEKAFGELCGRIGDNSDIETAAWLLAAVLLPGEDFTQPKQQLDEWGMELRLRIVGIEGAAHQATALAEFLGEELNFHGDEDDYYAAENSIFPNVIESRQGIPLSLSMLYMAVARRAGLVLHGVGLPGHFVVRLENAFLDPFHNGRRLYLDDCQRLLEGQGYELQPHHLMPCKPRVMLARMLNNLLHIADDEGNSELSTKLQGWLGTLQRTA